jgi:hypothetical protein
MEARNDTNSLRRKSRGQWTAEIGKSLKFEDYDVLYDHGVLSETVGKIVSYFSETKERGTQLSYLDIAIVKKNTNEAIVLVEIEATANRPKTIIADIFAFLMGERLAFQRRELEVGSKTILIVLGFSKVPHPKHNQYILEKVEKVKSALGTKNSMIGKVVIETFPNEKELPMQLQSLLENMFKREL